VKIAKRNIFISLVILTTAMAGCKEDNLIEVSINSKSTEVSLSLLTEVLSTFDIISDLSSSNVLFLKKDQSLLPNGLIINYIDTTFQDGNGLKIELDFGGLGEEPHGQLCKDNKYREGKMMVAINRPMSQLDAKLEVSFSEEFPYYTGNGKKMTKLVGQMALLRKSETEITFSIKELKTSLVETTKNIKDQATKVKITEVTKFLTELSKTDKVDNDNLVDLLQYYELVSEIKVANGV